jgi:hypothetical protein
MRTEDKSFDQFLDFITYLCTELVGGASPEYALERAIHYYGDRSPVPFQSAFDAIAEGTDSFVPAWTRIVKAYQFSREFRLVQLLGQFLDTGALLGGARMLRVIQQIRKNTALAKNRKNLVDAQRSKVIALSLVSSGVLGMIAAIAPILAPAFTALVLVRQQETMTSVLHVFGALYLTAIVSAYRLSQAARSSIRTVALSSLSFVLTFALTANLLAAIP